jgi:hypothetical protein
VSGQVLVTKAVNALIGDAHSRIGGPVEQAVERVRRREGGLWVGGHATLTDCELQFAANGLNRAAQDGTLDICVDLGQIQQVEVRPGLITNIVEVRSPKGLLKLRCFGAARFAQSIRDAIAAR